MTHVSFTMNPALEMNPKLGVLVMDELLDVMEFHSDDDSLRRVIRDADFAPDENDYDYDRKTWELRSKVMQAFLDFVRYQDEDDISSNSAKPLGVTKGLEEYPARACVVLDEVLSCVDERAKRTDLEKIRTTITHSVLDAAADATDEEKQLRKLYNGVMLAFDEFVRYCEDKPLPRDSSDCSPDYKTSDDDQDR
ncbi:hypothetical protein AWC38_SpisGene21069 [Stylophora pistillata]|uniref:Uncharacterized protein n=1 Tax=Stylophora pistillata TaxID=50429 RepID=A0A2B4RAR5_STYPI|nr:hypothetical protein AWC38_SpisGene21069 [Stylophora pistillata]